MTAITNYHKFSNLKQHEFIHTAKVVQMKD
jgi:hypothetical protein